MQLVGRASELAALRRMVAAPGPRLVLVEGEAGIGKTSLVRELGAARWAYGVDEGAPPLWLWRQLVPDVRPDAAGDRFALVGELRAALAGGGLLVVDDVQWADEPSLLVLHRLLRAGAPVVVCATRRTGESGAGWDRVGPDLLSGPDVARLAVGGLPDEAAADLVRAVAATGDAGAGSVAEPAADTTDVAWAVRVGGGNPLFLRELARSSPAAVGRSMGGVGDVITARVRRLDASVQRLLRAASLLAEDVELTVVARLLDEPTVACLPAVSAALAAGLLVDSGGGRFRFAHGLVRTVLAAQTPLQEAVVLHLRAAEALEDLHRHGLSAVSADIARHRAAVAVVGDRAPAVAWARRAAEDATRALAHEEAARLYRSALDCGGPALPPAERAESLLGLAAAEAAAGRHPETLAACREAVDLAPELVARAALLLEAIGERDRDRTVETWCVRALATATGAVRVRLLARLAEARYYGGDVEGARAPAAEAVAAAAEDSRQSVEARVAALRARQLTCSGPEFSGERAGLAAQMTALGEDCGRPDVELWGRLWTVDVLFERGDLGGIEVELTRLRSCVERRPGPLPRWHLLVATAALAQARGDLATARELGEEAFALLDALGHPAATGAFLSLLGGLGRHAGHSPDLAAPVLDDVGEVRAQLFARLGPAVALVESGRTAEAARLYRLTGPPREWEIPPYFRVQALAVGAQIAVGLGLPADVAWFVEALAPYADGHVVGGAGAANYLGPVALILGSCAAALGDLDGAVRHLTAALATSERIGAPGFAVEAACELGAVHLRRGDPAGRLLLTRARPTAVELGMAPWTARIDELLGRDGGPLTAREREVAELVAQGWSNREIAAALVLSERTVGNHVQHILTKLGVSNRGRIAAWMSSGMSSSPDARRPASP
ncbi:LuxR family transcriptional regulator [Pseudonocardia sp. WMMC193]|uniref:helix-turn-helix transcriptional regulator n=1 Tax=Pseudonocardia sp. WMMC193 TaxID=2911965 RepID=UPI001F001B06|nr:LuxR family transcriptional regulator [Pseudonocardia sp. WMMC193]MCF7552396.1 LuxR C-terminal-related transcriptional regulator [Pseudonocardia sp. WMMC193]